MRLIIQIWIFIYTLDVLSIISPNFLQIFISNISKVVAKTERYHGYKSPYLSPLGEENDENDTEFALWKKKR